MIRLHACRKGARPAAPSPARATGFPLKPLAWRVRQALALAACAPLSAAVWAGGPAPGVRIPLTALPTGAATQTAVGNIGGRTIYAPQIVSGSNFARNFYQVNANANGTVSATITQNDNAAILQWQTFDIGANATVNIVQPSSTAVLLNKVAGGDYSHMVLIEGALNANGQVYIYNPNGIIFGKTSQVNVNSLTASTLKIDDQRFLAGILAPAAGTPPQFAADPAVSMPGAVVVEAGTDAAGNSLQAQINAANGGRILLTGPVVTNNGVLNAPDGQVILAAGGKVYLTSSTDVSMRGLLVEVNNDNLPAASIGVATNGTLGQINVGRGNASMVGLAVNQMGVVSATTAVAENGSIYLHARGGATADPSGNVAAHKGGALVLGANSVTQVLPDFSDTTTTPGSSFTPSIVDLVGNTVHLQTNALIDAPAGQVTASAYSNGGSFDVSNDSNSHIYLDAGARIDVAGTTNTQLAMESNVIQVQLRGNELADSPLQRDSVVRGQTLSVDIRKGTPLGNIQGYLDLVEHGIGERTAGGGTITLNAGGDILINPGATLDVSGGMVSYLSGYVATTRLTSNGVAYDIGDATPDRIYDGVLAPVAGPRNFEQGYVQGYAAGTISLDAPTMVVRGDLLGGVTTGPMQRDASTAPAGGTLVLGNPQSAGDPTKLHLAANIHFDGDTTAGTAIPVFNDGQPVALQLPDSLKGDVDVSAATLGQNGFSRLQAYTDIGSIDVNQPVVLRPGGELTLVASGSIALDAGISIPGGKVSATSSQSVTVGDGVTIDVAGRWTNDRANASPALDAQGNPVTPVVLQGGSINLTASNSTTSSPIAVTLGNDVTLDASGGAWLNAQGTLTSGSGGGIVLGPATAALRSPDTMTLDLGSNLQLQAYGLANGGKLQISAPNVGLGVPSDATTNMLGLEASFFQQGGFSSFDIRAEGQLGVAFSTVIVPRTDNWFATSTTPLTASGSMADAFNVTTLPLAGAAGSRKPASLSLSAVREDTVGQGVLTVNPGTGVAVDPGGSVTLAAGTLLNIFGTVSAPGGTIDLYLTPSPTASTLTPYLAERSIWLGSQAVLDAAGSAADLWQDTRGVTHGNLLDGGQVNIGRTDGSQLLPADGYIVTAAGSLIDVSGTTAAMSLGSGKAGVQSGVLASNGGSINIQAREGVLLASTLLGAAGNSSARAGSFAMTLDREALSLNGYPQTPLDFVVSVPDPNPPSGGNSAVAGLAPGTSLDKFAGVGFVPAASINAGGFDTVSLKSGGAVDFDLTGGNLALTAQSSVTIDAPTLSALNTAVNHTVSLDAPYVAVGNSDWRYQSNALPAAGGGATLVVNAGTADIVGQSTLRGFNSAQFNTSGDVRLVGQTTFDPVVPGDAAAPPVHAFGSFEVSGNLTLNAAQVYPTSLSEFTLNASGGNGTVTFNSNGNAAPMPLAAAGTLTVQAQNIVQNGVVRAPLGAIDFEAGDSLTYGAGSITSVTASSDVPLGFVQNGRDWLYDFGNGNTINLSDPTASNYVALPGKSITSRAGSVTVGQGATLDLSGGGDLYAYEFTPGPGGSKDVLAAANTFAIVPGFSGTLAPSDFQYDASSGLQAGDKVYLSATSGLAAGYYTLLPAHYALLPGAYSVSAVAGTQNMTASQNRTLTVGSLLVAGYETSLGGGADNFWQGFLLTPTALVRQQSEFTDHTANAFLTTSGLTLPADGGHVVFDVGQSLALNGVVNLHGAADGRNGIADISAPSLVVVSDAAQALPAAAGSDATVLLASDLSALNADSLLLGGVRTTQGDSQTVTVGAGQVIIANDAAHPLQGPEILIAAGSQQTLDPVSGAVTTAAGTAGAGLVQVEAGSSIIASGAVTHTPVTLNLINKSNPDQLGADGALLRVSNGAAVDVNRTFTRSDGTVVGPAGVAGTLDIAAGAQIAAGGAAVLDATQNASIGASPELGAGAALQLGANRISLGSAAPAGVAGARFDDAALAGFDSLATLTLTSYSTIDVYGSLALGNGVLQNLSLKAAGIQSFGGAGDSVVFNAANTLRIDGNGVAGAAPAAATGGGQLSFNARNIEIGNGSFSATGFTQTVLNATGDITAAGHGGAFVADASLTLNSARITAASGADAAFGAGGALALVQGAGAGVTLPALQLGGRLSFNADTIAASATISALSGRIDFNAAHGIVIGGGTYSAGGGSQVFGSTTAYTPGGSIVLDGGAGNVNVASAATLDVSAVGAAAGSISVQSVNGGSGQVTLDGTLKGGAAPGVDGAAQAGGSVTLDTDQLNGGFGALNARLDAAGFDSTRSFRLRSGDVTLAQGETITAHDVSIAADNGSIVVGGTINAAGSKGGSIELYAGEASAGSGSGNVTLTGSAQLLANANIDPAQVTSAAGSTGDGGSIVLGTATADGSAPTVTRGDASITVAGGARLDVSGSGQGQGGTVLLRAPRIATNNDVAVAALDTSGILGSRSTAIEGYKVYTASTISANADSATNLQVADASGAPKGKMWDEANAFTANQGAMLARLGIAAGNPLVLQPGLEVRSNGDLTVSVNEAATVAKQNRGWNLDAWRFNGQPGVLTLRAAGNLNINGSISDGFTKTAVASMPDWALDTSPTGAASWSYRLAGGSDFTAADPLAVKPATASGDVKLSFTRLTNTTADSPVALIRTGTGNIDIAAGRDVVLDTLDVTTGKLLNGSTSGVNFASDNLLGATIYTAGRASSNVPPAATEPAPTDANNSAYGPATVTAAQFTDSGGSIVIDAGRNITGPITQQMINNWLYRQGQVTTGSSGVTQFANVQVGRGSGPLQYTAWWSRPDYFNQGIATLGGGDITVRASTGTISDLSASTATNGFVTTVGGTPVENGGGDLVVSAGGDIRGGIFYVQKGSAEITAGDSITAGNRQVVISGTTVPVALYPILAAGDSQFNVVAGGDLGIETVINPMLWDQSPNNAKADGVSNLLSVNQLSYFSTYTTDSAVNFTAITGDLLYNRNDNALKAIPGINASGYTALSFLLPASLSAVAVNGNINLQNGFTLWPSPDGQLQLLAGGSVTATAAFTQPVVMLDSDPSTLLPVSAPYLPTVGSIDVKAATGDASATGISYHTAGGLHAADTQPVRIVALRGDVSFKANNIDGTTATGSLVLSKVLELSAGRDVIDAGFTVQQLAASDVSTVTAGRDIIDTTLPGVSGGTLVRHVVTGPGRIDFTAGRNFDLGNSRGVTTRGNLDNPYLPADGAAINIVAGATPDYAGFAASLGSPDGFAATDQAAVLAYMHQVTPGLPADATVDDAWVAFNALPAALKRPLFDTLFFSALQQASGAVGGGALDLKHFDAIIASLFPTAAITGGDVNVFGSQLKTSRGGAINVYAPGGSVFAGLVSVPSFLQTKSAADLGIFTIGGGAIQSLVKNDFLVNQGRVFTLGGGDITLVSQYGDIDAGKGAKTAQAAPPPILTTDQNGNTQVDISGSISGSGIATLRTGPSVPASDVFPIAPRGTFDAGDAGVRSTGSVNIVAQTVLNAGNISAAGTISGAKSADTSGLAGIVAPPASATPAPKTDALTAPPDPSAANNLTVELLGYGTEVQQSVIQDGQNQPSTDSAAGTDRKDRQDRK